MPFSRYIFPGFVVVLGMPWMLTGQNWMFLNLIAGLPRGKGLNLSDYLQNFSDPSFAFLQTSCITGLFPWLLVTHIAKPLDDAKVRLMGQPWWPAISIMMLPGIFYQHFFKVFVYHLQGDSAMGGAMNIFHAPSTGLSIVTLLATINIALLLWRPTVLGRRGFTDSCLPVPPSHSEIVDISRFPIGLGDVRSKRLEAIAHFYANGHVSNSVNTNGQPSTFMGKHDQQGILLIRATPAIDRCRQICLMVGNKFIQFTLEAMRDYATRRTMGDAVNHLSLDQIFPKAVLCAKVSSLAVLFDVRFPPRKQRAELDVGVKGHPPICVAVMSRLGDIEWAAGGGTAPVIHQFDSMFGGTGASGVPILSQMPQGWLDERGLHSLRVSAYLLLLYVDFNGQGQASTGLHAEAHNFRLNTDAALHDLCTRGTSCFDHVVLIGSDVKARDGVSIGGRSKSNTAHIVELLAAISMSHGLKPAAAGNDAHVMIRAVADQISPDENPKSELAGQMMAREALSAVAWLNNFSLEGESFQSFDVPTFLSGAPWASQYLSAEGQSQRQQQGGLVQHQKQRRSLSQDRHRRLHGNPAATVAAVQQQNRHRFEPGTEHPADAGARHHPQKRSCLGLGPVSLKQVTGDERHHRGPQASQGYLQAWGDGSQLNGRSGGCTVVPQ